MPKTIGQEMVADLQAMEKGEPVAVSYFVPGIPIPQGSMKIVQRGKYSAMTSDNEKTMPWRAIVSAYSSRAMTGLPKYVGPLSVSLHFAFPRLKDHFKKDGTLKASAPKYKPTKPDIDKLERATLDAMTGIVFIDDGQVCEVNKTKRFVHEGTYSEPGVFVRIVALS